MSSANATSSTTAATESAGRAKFGTFGGVFTPSILTILGVVMYLRLGWVVGAQGLWGALAVVAVSHLISIATGLSVSSIATNRTVGAGGAYFMISRSLGAPAGAAIGYPLFLGQALGTAFYIIGFTEALATLLGLDAFTQKLVGSGVILLLTVVSLKSSSLVIKTQYLVMAVIVASLVSFFMGRAPEATSTLGWSNPRNASFVEVFAVFFPAVTGIMAGVSMSGDLKDPRRSIPRGTLAAIVVGLIVYTAFPIWLSYNASYQTLFDDKDVVWKIARFPSLIYAGVWAATLSSAMGSVLTAPRTLQALAIDRLAPSIFAKGFGRSREPAGGIVATFALAQAAVWLGDLDAVAPVLTMFFLVTYGVTNLACGLEKWAASPSFRPEFQVPAGVSLFGAFACFYVMSILDMLAMLVALGVCAVIFVIAQRRALGTTYGDARHGIWAALVRSALYRLKQVRFHPSNWRPNLVILGGDPNKRSHLLKLGGAIVQDRGIVTYTQLVKGRIADLAEERRQLVARVGEEVAEAHPFVFYRADIVEDVYRGVVAIAQSHGIGSFEANTVMLGWVGKPERYQDYLRMLRDLEHLDRSVLLVRKADRFHENRQKAIDVWWGGMDRNGGLMLLLAFLLRAHPSYRNARVRVITVVDNETARAMATAGIQRVLASSRLTAEPLVLLREGRPLAELMEANSGKADLAIMGLRIPPEGEATDGYFERLEPMLKGLPTTILVHSARHFESEPVLFDHEP